SSWIRKTSPPGWRRVRVCTPGCWPLSTMTPSGRKTHASRASGRLPSISTCPATLDRRRAPRQKSSPSSLSWICLPRPSRARRPKSRSSGPRAKFGKFIRKLRNVKAGPGEASRPSQEEQSMQVADRITTVPREHPLKRLRTFLDNEQVLGYLVIAPALLLLLVLVAYPFSIPLNPSL